MGHSVMIRPLALSMLAIAAPLVGAACSSKIVSAFDPGICARASACTWTPDTSFGASCELVRGMLHDGTLGWLGTDEGGSLRWPAAAHRRAAVADLTSRATLEGAPRLRADRVDAIHRAHEPDVPRPPPALVHVGALRTVLVRRAAGTHVRRARAGRQSGIAVEGNREAGERADGVNAPHGRPAISRRPVGALRTVSVLRTVGAHVRRASRGRRGAGARRLHDLVRRGGR